MTDGERETLAIALDHAWRWYENRRSRALTLLQTLVVYLAIVGAAYAAAVQAQLFGAAGFVCLMVAPILVAVEQEGTRLHRSAALAADAVAELQNRLADELGTESLRLHQREIASQATTPRYLGYDITKWLMYLSAGGVLISAVYTWVFLP
ncbi:hypothetical protein [Streptomyces sp. NPDC060205]|uniref:hypothetical protein n=1 Tax=Streptomyces sp. NPDC060205 TaxID=3347072 RepID=UPI0036498A32